MHLFTKQQRLDLVPNTFKRQYPKNRQLFDGSWTDEIYAQLVALDNKTENAINSVLDDSWTKHRCDVCRSDCDFLVSMETKAHEEYGNSLICKKCLEKAIKLINGMA